MPINNSISLDHNPSGDDEDGCTLANILPDEKTSEAPYKELAQKDAYKKTFQALMGTLSPFEALVLEEYLAERSYREAARNISKKLGVRHNAKSVDNSLLRIRKKAFEILSENGFEGAPIFL